MTSTPLTCPKCGSNQLTTGCKPFTLRVLDWFHRCLSCGHVIPLGIKHEPRPEDYRRDERRQELKNRIIALQGELS